MAGFEYRLEDNLHHLQEELKNKQYQPGEYRSFYIHEPKRRLISAAPFRDRVVHHALCNLIEPVFERSFIFDSYANRVGKGTHRALDRVQEYARQYKYFLQCDSKQFFSSIDHLVLRDILERKITGQNILWLIDSILESGQGVLNESYDTVYFPGDNLFAWNRPRGLPIGNLTSQFWANVYLNPFDHFVKRELGSKAYVRYVDDFILFANEKQILWQWKQQLIDRLEKLRLTIHSGIHPRPVDEGVPFLGFIVYPQNRRLKRRKGIYYQRKLKKMSQMFSQGEITMGDLNVSVQGWVNHVRYGNTVGLRKSIFKNNMF